MSDIISAHDFMQSHMDSSFEGPFIGANTPYTADSPIGNFAPSDLYGSYFAGEVPATDSTIELVPTYCP